MTHFHLLDGEVVIDVAFLFQVDEFHHEELLFGLAFEIQRSEDILIRFIDCLFLGFSWLHSNGLECHRTLDSSVVYLH